LSNCYQEDIENTPFSVTVLPYIHGGYHWFISRDGDDGEWPSVCMAPLATPYEAVQDALDALGHDLNEWRTHVDKKRKEWSSQQ
jgi:hypothetical protein